MDRDFPDCCGLILQLPDEGPTPYENCQSPWVSFIYQERAGSFVVLQKHVSKAPFLKLPACNSVFMSCLDIEV